MFAVIRSGGKQYRVAPDDRISVEKLVAQPGEVITIGDVLMVGGGGGSPVVGAPMVAGAAVHAEVVEHTRSDKIIVFKKRRRQKSRSLKGHRQHQTILRITGIEAEGFEGVAAPAAEPVAEAVEPEAQAADQAAAPDTAVEAATSDPSIPTETDAAPDGDEKPKE